MIQDLLFAVALAVAFILGVHYGRRDMRKRLLEKEGMEDDK
jgi:uncharacterized protein YneF (UPF0154 family)